MCPKKYSNSGRYPYSFLQIFHEDYAMRIPDNSGLNLVGRNYRFAFSGARSPGEVSEAISQFRICQHARHSSCR